MKHLYSLVFALIALTSANLSSAQIVYPLPSTTPSGCNGSVHFYDNANYDLADWTWTWYEDSTTIIATNDSVVSNLCAGLYSLVLDSSGSSITVYVTVTDPCSNFSLSMNNNQTTPGNCLAHASASPSGGAYPYSFSWSNGATVSYQYGLCAGVYTVTCVDANGCSLSESATVMDSVPPVNPLCASLALSATTTSAITGYNTGGIQATANGGNPPYSYALNGSPFQATGTFAMLFSGSYNIECVDMIGCMTSLNVIVNDYNILPNLTSSNDSTNSCTGFASVSPTGGVTPYSYLWSNGAATSSISNLCAGNYSVVIEDANGNTTSASFTITNPCSYFTASASSTNCTAGNCDGTFTVLNVNGSLPVIWEWSTIGFANQSTLNNLCPGTYSCTITEAGGCDVTLSVTITDPCTNFTSTISSTQSTNSAACDGSITFNAIGGTAPYTYELNNAITQTTNIFDSLCAGSYTIICLDASGCIRVETETITNSGPAPIEANLTIQNDFTGTCSGFAAVAPTGGVGGYDYLWSNGSISGSVNNLCVGTYTVLIIDANLDSLTVSFVITNPCLAFTGVASSTPVSAPAICDGTSTFNASGGSAPYQYSWDNGVTFSPNSTISNLCAGTWNFICTDAIGCLISQPITVLDSSITISNLSVNLSQTDDYTGNCSGSASVAPTGGSGAYFVEWSTGQTGNSVSNLCAGIYSVLVWSTFYSDSTLVNFVIADSAATYGNNPYPNGTINDTLYTDLVTNCIIDYSDIDSASLYQAVYNSSTQSLYVTWAVYSPTDTVYISDTLALIGNPGYYSLTISVYCPNKSGNDFMKITGGIYFDGTNVYFSTLGVAENLLDQVSIYPNPFTSSISVDNKEGVIQALKLVDLNGRVLSEMTNVHSGLIEMNQLESISSGTYLLILSGENISKTVKVIK